MNTLINQYSFVAISILLIIAAGFFLLGNKPKFKNYLIFGAIVAAFIVGWVILHPRQTIFMNNAKSVQAMIGSGKPVLLEFQSPY